MKTIHFASYKYNFYEYSLAPEMLNPAKVNTGSFQNA